MPSENTQQDGNTQQGRGTQQGGELERRKNKVFLCHTRALAQALATQSTVRCSLTSKRNAEIHAISRQLEDDLHMP
jgi:hypothetical protein